MMANFVLVWVLVVTGGARPAVFSPPVEDLASCQRLQRAIKYQDTQCVQIRILVNKQFDNKCECCYTVILLGDIEMKTETVKVQRVRERNPLVALAMFRRAGSHRKSNKALRRSENQKRDW